MTDEAKGFVLFKSQYKHIRNLTEKQKAEILDAIYKYNLGEDFIFEDETTNIIFGFIQDAMDATAEKWNKRHEGYVRRGKESQQAKLNNANQNSTMGSNGEQSPAMGSNGEQSPAMGSNGEQSPAMGSNGELYNNDNDNDNDNNNDNEKKKEIKKKKEHPLENETTTLESFRKFRQWQWDNCPNTMNSKPYFKSYITEEEYKKLITKQDPSLTPQGCQEAEKKIQGLLLQIENRPDYIKKYSSLYLTINNWLDNDKKRSLTYNNSNTQE